MGNQIIKIPIIMYHRILNKKDMDFFSSYNEAGSVMKVSDFITQINFLNKKYSIISFKELLAYLNKKGDLPSNPCVLSFDDGYIDHYRNVFPILKKLKLPAIYFIMGDCISGTGKVRWLDKLYYIVDNSPYCKNSSKFKEIISNFYKIQMGQNDLYKFNKLKNFIRNSPRKNEIIDHLSLALNVNLNLDKLNKKLYLSKEHILEMLNCRMDFGAHTMSHPDLSTVTLDVAKEEIINSGIVLRNLTHHEKIPFAYPFGGLMTYNKNIIKILKTNNFSCSCTSIPGSNEQNTPLFELKRIDSMSIQKKIS
jgi:peptidoglycan/xylan/chitin deacetylase (PgdA/CDA1 family)